MITLRLDKNGGINKGDIKAFEHDNLSEVYIIQLYKNGAIYDLTNKSIELTMVERKRKIGDMVSLPIYEATEGKVKLEVVSDITKQDGIYDFKLTVKDTAGLIETFPSFQVEIKNDITDSITGEIIQDPNFTILTEGLKALADYNIYKTNALKVPEIEQDIVEINEQLDNNAIEINDKIKRVNERVNEVAQIGTTVEVLERVTKEEIDRQVEDGTIANLTIKENSIQDDRLNNELRFNKIYKSFHSLFLEKNDNDNFDLSTIDENDWYEGTKFGGISKYIKPCNNQFLKSLGIKNWIWFDYNEAFDYGISRTIFYKNKYKDTIKNKYYKVVYFFYNENDTIETFNNNTAYATSDEKIVLLPSKVTKEKIDDKLIKVTKTGLIPSDSEYNTLLIGSNFRDNISDSIPASAMGVGGFYCKVSDTDMENEVDSFSLFNNKIPNIEKKLFNLNIFKRWYGKTINCLGDSITNGSVGEPSWVYLLKDICGFNVTNNYGTHGSTITNNGSNSFIQRYQAMEDCDIVFVWGGINDFHWCVDEEYTFGNIDSRDDKSFYGALHTLITGLINKYPDKYILFATPMKAAKFHDRPAWNETNLLGKKLIDYRNAIIEVCDYYSVPVLDLYSCSGITTNVSSQSTLLLSDGVHPNSLGNKKLANTIGGFINHN